MKDDRKATGTPEEVAQAKPRAELLASEPDPDLPPRFYDFYSWEKDAELKAQLLEPWIRYFKNMRKAAVAQGAVEAKND